MFLLLCLVAVEAESRIAPRVWTFGPLDVHEDVFEHVSEHIALLLSFSGGRKAG